MKKSALLLRNADFDIQTRLCRSMAPPPDREGQTVVQERRLSDGTSGVAAVGDGLRVVGSRRRDATAGTEHRNAHHAGRCGLRIHIVLFHCCYCFIVGCCFPEKGSGGTAVWETILMETIPFTQETEAPILKNPKNIRPATNLFPLLIDDKGAADYSLRGCPTAL